MAVHKAGRPAKPARKKRQQLHVSLYAEDLERLDQLTDNRSEFLRECIAKAWEEKCGGEEVTFSVTLPKAVARELLKTAGPPTPRRLAFAPPALRPKPEPVG